MKMHPNNPRDNLSSTAMSHRILMEFKTSSMLKMTKRNLFIGQCILSLGIYLFYSLPIHSLSSKVVGWLIFQISALAWTLWTTDYEIPLLPLILSIYTVYFSLPLFYIENVIRLHAVFPIQEPLTRTVLLMVLAAEISIIAGWYLGRRQFLTRRRQYVIPVMNLQILAFIIIIVQIILSYASIASHDFELGASRQIVNGMFNPFLAIGILFYVSIEQGWNVFRIGGITVIVLLFIANTMSSTMLGDTIMVFVLIGILSFRVYKKLTIGLGVLLVLAGIFLQPVKLEYRYTVTRIEDTGRHLTLSEKTKLYGAIMWANWTGEQIKSYYDESASMQAGKRYAMLPILEILLSETPRNIPYQLGKTFKFVLFSPIPRFLYPDKPTAQEANTWFAKAYGLVDTEIAKRTMVGISHLGEVYVNFGVIGIPCFFLLYGFVIRKFMQLVQRHDRGLTRKVVMAAIAPQFFSIESTMTGFIVGVVYAGIFTYVIIQIASLRFLGVNKSET